MAQSVSGRVVVGQTWEDLDPRAEGRRLIVLEVGMSHALARVVANPRAPHSIGREVRIKLERFEPGARGYRCIG